MSFVAGRHGELSNARATSDLLVEAIDAFDEPLLFSIVSGEKSRANFLLFLPEALARNLLSNSSRMKTGDTLNTTRLIRSQRTGVLLPREGTFVRDIEILGRKLIVVNFGSAGEEYLFPNEVLDETRNSQSANGYSITTRRSRRNKP